MGNILRAGSCKIEDNITLLCKISEDKFPIGEIILQWGIEIDHLLVDSRF